MPMRCVPRCCSAKSADEYNHRDRDDERLRGGRRHADALDRRKYRDGRRDDSVAEEHARAENDEERQPRRLRQHAALHGRKHDAQQRQDAALAVVRDAHHHADVAHEHDEYQRPQDEAEDAEHVACVGVTLRALTKHCRNA